MEISLEVSTEPDRELLNDPVIPRLGIVKKSAPCYRATHTPCSMPSVHNGKGTGSASMPINRRVRRAHRHTVGSPLR